jgi:hypothetical protein
VHVNLIDTTISNIQYIFEETFRVKNFILFHVTKSSLAIIFSFISEGTLAIDLIVRTRCDGAIGEKLESPVPDVFFLFIN